MTSSSGNGTVIPTDTISSYLMLEHDPQRIYRRLRCQTPIVYLEAIKRIIFTKAEDVYRVKTDKEYFGSYDTKSPMHRAFGGHTLMRKDGQAHMCERRAMEPSFDPSCLQNHWLPTFEALTDTHLEKLSQMQTTDLLSSFAEPLSAGYLRLVLGVEDVTDSKLYDWASALIQGATNSNFDSTVFEKSDRANDEMNRRFDPLIEGYQGTQNPSVLSAMANQSDPIPLSQIRTNMKICIGGALKETRDALLSTLFGLLSYPDQLLSCIEQNAWDRACEEGLRWVAPIQASPRIVKKSLVMRGVRIPKGETVMAIQGSANHDEDIWDVPHQFNVFRKPQRNYTFGDGSHQCMGGDIYRLLIAKVVLPKLFDHFPNISLSDEKTVEFRGFVFRGPTSLPVSLI